MGKENHTVTLEELKEMSEVDVRTVDRDTLVDVDGVHIQTDLPQEERIADYLRQIKNPYCYVSHGVIIKISFSGTKKLEECLGECILIEA